MATPIDPKSLRVVDLREELGKRDLAKTGKKDELVARLEQALKDELTASSASTNENEPAEETKEEHSQEKDSMQQEQQTEPTQIEEEKQTTTNTVSGLDSTETNRPLENGATDTSHQQQQQQLQQQGKGEENRAMTDTKTATTREERAAVDTMADDKTRQPFDEQGNEVLKRKRDDSADDGQEEKRNKTELETLPSSQPADTEDQSAVCIKGFVRPLITKNLHEFISQYGDIKRFWIDPIKTHCYVIYETEEAAKKAFDGIEGTIYPPGTGKTVTVIKLTPTQSTKLINYEQKIAERRGRANWEKLIENVLNNISIDEPSPSTKSPTTESPPSAAKRRLGGLEQITKQLQQRTAISAIMDQEQQQLQQSQRSVSILNRLSNSGEISFLSNKKETEETLPMTGKALDDLFLKTKADPPLYFLPVDKDVAEKRLKSMRSK